MSNYRAQTNACMWKLGDDNFHNGEMTEAGSVAEYMTHSKAVNVAAQARHSQ